MTRFEKLLRELGVDEFDFEVGKFDTSPRAWLEKQLRAMGWVREIKAAEPPTCARACCEETR